MRARPAPAPDSPPFLLAALVLGAVAASRFLALAAEPGEIDEAVFSGAVLRYDLFDLSPQAPGFPVWILIGRLLLPLAHGPFEALAIASTLLSACAFPALYVWGKRLVGGWAALSGTVFAAALPVVWVNGGRAFSDSPATALLLGALASLVVAEEAGDGRPARLLALTAGLLAAAGVGVRPHLVLAFGPLLLLALRPLPRAERVAVVAAGTAGTLAWTVWLLAQAGGALGLLASLTERAEFRSRALATGTLGTLLDSFLVRDFLSWRRAAVVLAVAAVGLAALVRERRRGALDLPVLLVPAFLSLWFLHSRAMSRYSVPFVLGLALLVGAGLRAIGRRGPAAFALALLPAAVFGRETLDEIRTYAHVETPPIAALRHLERYVHPGRESIVADDVFQPFLRLERWEGRLAAWGYLDSEFASAPRQINKRLVRLADLSHEPDPPDLASPPWRSWYHGGRVAEALSNRRLITVGVADPAPPLFGAGFGVRERVAGQPTFRWAGPGAHLFVPGLNGPRIGLLVGERDGGPTTLTVADAVTGATVLTRTLPVGPFELAIAAPEVYGPLPRPAEYVLTCDRPRALPPLGSAGARRPSGCFTLREWTTSIEPGEVWERQGVRYVVDVGSRRDRAADPRGFYPPESVAVADLRWTTGDASVLWMPRPGFVPRRIVLRARAPGREPARVVLAAGGLAIGEVEVAAGDLAEVSLALPDAVTALLVEGGPVRIRLTASTVVPREAGLGPDGRALGVAVDRIALEEGSATVSP